MLQQTRVETVKSYWLNWMAKYPTIEQLAAAPEDDVLAAWRGLGYYSRATRIHAAAKLVVAHPTYQGLLPSDPVELEKNVPGVGPYTAGAISSIVFGKPVPILDGNVARVLSRQLGLYANPKAKLTTDLQWAAAKVLVEKAYEVGEKKGNVPGEWNQALMELGSTVCTPQKPNCGECPIRDSCRAYAEAAADAGKGKNSQAQAAVLDIEDLCTFCEPFPSEEGEDAAAGEGEKAVQTAGVKKLRQATLSFAGSSRPVAPLPDARPQVSANLHKHIQKYPMKLDKKKIRQEECLVLIIKATKAKDKLWLLEKRPDSGLLANMWQFPALTLSTTTSEGKRTEEFPTSPIPERVIARFIDHVYGDVVGYESTEKVGSIKHIFSHLELTMHVYKVQMQGSHGKGSWTRDGPYKDDKNFGCRLRERATMKWVTRKELEAETMGTGMRNAWLALQTLEQQPLAKRQIKEKPLDFDPQDYLNPPDYMCK